MAVVNKAAMNNPDRVLCGRKFSFLWNKCPGVRLYGMLHCMLSVGLIFLLYFFKKLKTFSRVAVSFYIPTSSVLETACLCLLVAVYRRR